MEIIRNTSKVYRQLLYGAFLLGALFIIAGIILVALKSDGITEFEILGQKFKSQNVGIASIFLGAVTIIFLIRYFLNSFDRTVMAESSITTSEITKSERKKLNFSTII